MAWCQGESWRGRVLPDRRLAEVIVPLLSPPPMKPTGQSLVVP